MDELINLAMQLERGCSCEYDYRCLNCDRVIRVRELKAATTQK